jgi:putative restriction endonuclease
MAARQARSPGRARGRPIGIGARCYPGEVTAVVLESAFGSEYEDTPSSYEFPERYLRHFGTPSGSDPLVAVIYEPRGDSGHGKMAYVGVVTISRPPYATGRQSKNNERLWRVDYDGPAAPFENDVHREVHGQPVETWLGALPRGRDRNVATFGRAVRPLADPDLERILVLGNAAEVGLALYPTVDDHSEIGVQVRERTERLVSTIQRDARFRESVLTAYGKRCAISGLDLGSTSATRALGVIDAAHIRPVGHSGPDVVANGLPLTPTLHRLFDIGLFTVEYLDGKPVVRTSPELEPTMIAAPARGFDLPLRTGLALLTPGNATQWPSPDQLKYHQRQIFRG